MSDKVLGFFMFLGTLAISLFVTVFGWEICKLVYNHWVYYACVIMADIYLWTDYIFTIFFWRKDK